MTPPINDKTILITGATAGIGKEAALALARQKARVVVVGRNAQKTRDTVAWLQHESDNEAVDSLLADLSSQVEVRQLAEDFLSRYDRLDVLINNAGAYFISRKESVDGYEMTFATNHLNYFLLTNLLLDTLIASAPSRIVNVSSAGHRGMTLDFDDLQGEKKYAGMQAYGKSKLANLYFTYELARRLQGTDVTVNALHPGFVATDLGSNNLGPLGPAMKRLLNTFVGISPEKGAETIVYLASSPEVDGVTGKYYIEKNPVASSPISYDEQAAHRLWELSEEMTALKALAV